MPLPAWSEPRTLTNRLDASRDSGVSQEVPDKSGLALPRGGVMSTVGRQEGRDDQLRMYLDWQWLTGDQSKGQSEWLLV